MDATFAALLTALSELDSYATFDRVQALDALSGELPRLRDLAPAAWKAMLAEIEDDVTELRGAAAVATARYEQAQRLLETLTVLAERAGVEHVERTLGDEDGRVRNDVAQASTTRDAIVRVMLRRPNRQWTPVMVHDDLHRYSRPVAKSNVQVTLRRLASEGVVTKTGRGAYQLSWSTVLAAEDEDWSALSHDDWLTQLNRLSTRLVARFVQQRAIEIDREEQDWLDAAAISGFVAAAVHDRTWPHPEQRPNRAETAEIMWRAVEEHYTRATASGVWEIEAQPEGGDQPDPA